MFSLEEKPSSGGLCQAAGMERREVLRTCAAAAAGGVIAGAVVYKMFAHNSSSLGNQMPSDSVKQSPQTAQTD